MQRGIGEYQVGSGSWFPVIKIGFGEAGQDISRGLIGEGARVPAAFDILFPDNEKGQRLRDVAAQGAVAHLSPKQIFMDMNSTSPAKKREAAAVI